MEVSFELDVSARCAGCGAECDVPDGTGTRVLRTDEASYVEVPEPCLCGSTTVRVVLSVE